MYSEDNTKEILIKLCDDFNLEKDMAKKVYVLGSLMILFTILEKADYGVSIFKEKLTQTKINVEEVIAVLNKKDSDLYPMC